MTTANDIALTAVEAMRQACFDAVVSNPQDKDALSAILKIDAAALISAHAKSEAAAVCAMAELREALSRKAQHATDLVPE